MSVVLDIPVILMLKLCFMRVNCVYFDYNIVNAKRVECFLACVKVVSHENLSCFYRNLLFNLL